MFAWTSVLIICSYHLVHGPTRTSWVEARRLFKLAIRQGTGDLSRTVLVLVEKAILAERAQASATPSTTSGKGNKGKKKGQR